MSAAIANTVVSIVPDRAEYAERIRNRLADSIEAVLDVGRTLIEAKDALAHGEFQKMVREDLGWSPRTAQRFMAIARHPTLSNATHVSYLPPSWGALAELARIEPKQLEMAITSGRVRPDMKRTEVGRLVNEDARRRPARRKKTRKPPESVPNAPVFQQTNDQIVVALGEEARATLEHIRWLLGQLAPALEAGLFTEADEKGSDYDHQAIDVLLIIAGAIEKHSNLAQAETLEAVNA